MEGEADVEIAFSWCGRRFLVTPFPLVAVLPSVLMVVFFSLMGGPWGLVFSLFLTIPWYVSRVVDSALVLGPHHLRHRVIHTVERERIRRLVTATSVHHDDAPYTERLERLHTFLKLDDDHDVELDVLPTGPRNPRAWNRLALYAEEIATWAGVPHDLVLGSTYHPQCWPYAHGVEEDDLHGRPRVPWWERRWPVIRSEPEEQALEEEPVAPRDGPTCQPGSSEYEQLRERYGLEVAERHRRLAERAHQVNQSERAGEPV